MNITVFLGAWEGNDPTFSAAVKELGTWIGKSGNVLVYGGSKSGLMGILAGSVLDAGGRVIGIEPQAFVDSALQLDGLTELIVTRNMDERIEKLIALGEAFIAFPGGTGTLEELAKVMSMLSLNCLDAPCIVYNLNGYYDCLMELLQKMVTYGLSTAERQKRIHFVESFGDIADLLK